MTNKFKIGDKVVPISKSIWGNLEESCRWSKAQKLNQKFLYVVDYDTTNNKDHYVCLECNDDDGGDFFMEQDLIPYVEEFVLPEKWDIVATKETVDVIAKWFDENWTTENTGFYQTNKYIQRYRYGLAPGNVLFCNSDEDYKEITFEQFKQHVLKSNEMTELPKKWRIQRTKDNYKIINAYYNTLKNGDYTSSSGWCYNEKITSKDLNHDYSDTNGTTRAGFKKSDYQEINLETFIKLTTKSNMKEIIGYKCPQNLSGGSDKIAPKGTLYVKHSCNDFLYIPEDGETYLSVPKEIVETWEPVYAQDEYKVGDWVYVTKTELSLHKKEGDVFKVVKVDNQYYKYLYFDANSSVSSDRVRKATTQEVEAHLIAQAKEKGFKTGVNFTGIRDTKVGEKYSNSSTNRNVDSRFNMECGSTFYYNETTDTLLVHGFGLGVVYEQGKWATIAPKEEIVSVGGKFDVKIKDGKIYHKSDDITTFVQDMIQKNNAIEAVYGNNYKVGFKDIIFSFTGCEKHESKLSDWKKVLDTYNKF